jgi:3-methylfumaryl-CoA hydratase
VSRHRASTAQVFRYSALTFNAHRIHYDLPYARDVEGYAGIVVQGPLLATRLATAIEARHGRLARLDFRLVAPTVVDEEYRCCLGGERAWIEGADGSLRMEAGFAVDTP